MGVLADALVARGYNPTDAANAENGPRAAELAREYLGSSGGAQGYLDVAGQYVSSIVGGVQKPESYAKNHPFSFDEALAKQAATAEYAPYYTRLVTDYTQDVERTKARSAEDMKSTIEQLNAGKEYYTGVQRRALDTSTRQTNEGYAGNGLFFSGVRERDIKQLQTENQASMENYLGSYKYNVGQAELGNTRTKENQDTALSQYTRDTTEAQRAAVAANVLQRKSEYINEYNTKMADYYASANNGLA